MNWFEELPKVELHVHLEGSIPLGGLWNLIQKYDGDSSVPDSAALEKRFSYRDFPHFIETWAWKNQFLREYEDFVYIAELVAGDFARQNIQYAEMFFSPSLFGQRGLSVQSVAEAVRKGLSRVPAVEVALIADLIRDYGPVAEMLTLEQLAEVRDLGIVGIGIGGSEHEFPPEPFADLFRKARNMGFHTNAHAGEAAGPESIWGAIRSLGAERIGHGTRAREDESLLRYLADGETSIEMCPVSDVRTGVVDVLANHPIRDYFLRGISVSVNTDDPKMFHTSLAEEYHQLVVECGFSKEEICSLVLLAIESSWLSEEDKRALAASFKADDAWIGHPEA